jgi:hypothetical protein
VTTDVEAAVAQAFRDELGRVVATLIRVTGDWDLAEKCAQDAFTLALQRWPPDGIPPRSAAKLPGMLTARRWCRSCQMTGTKTETWPPSLRPECRILIDLIVLSQINPGDRVLPGNQLPQLSQLRVPPLVSRETPQPLLTENVP